MNKEEFVRAIKTVEKSAIKGFEKTIATPPGRKPSPDLIEISTLFNSLDEKAKATLMKLAVLASRLATNNLLSVIDGNVAMEFTDAKGDLELFFCKDDSRVRLNTTEGETLSEIYRHVE